MTERLDRAEIERILEVAAEQMKERGQTADRQPGDDRPAMPILVLEEEMFSAVADSDLARKVSELGRLGRATGLSGKGNAR